MSQETNGAIALLSQTVRQHELLIAAIASEHEYVYESMKLPCSDNTFLCYWGGYMVTKNILLGLNRKDLILEVRQEIINRVRGLV